MYEGRLFYGKDAFEGLRTMDRRRRSVLDKMQAESIPELALKLGGTTLQMPQRAAP